MLGVKRDVLCGFKGDRDLKGLGLYIVFLGSVNVFAEVIAFGFSGLGLGFPHNFHSSFVLRKSA